MELFEKCQDSHLRNMNKCRVPVRILVKQDKANADYLKQGKGLTELFDKRQMYCVVFWTHISSFLDVHTIFRCNSLENMNKYKAFVRIVVR